jgi:hypothetical protein
MNEDIKWALITASVIVISLWIAITIFEWFTVANYDPCFWGSGLEPSWCYIHSRYSLVETIINQWKGLMAMRIL